MMLRAANPKHGMPCSTQHAFNPRAPTRTRSQRLHVVRAMHLGPQELTRVAVTLITTGLALRTPASQQLPPSQILTATALAAAGTAYETLGLPGQGTDPTLLAASSYALYRAWRTYDAPPHAVGLRAGVHAHAGHDLLLECVTLAALADGAARASVLVGQGPHVLTAAALAPALWAAARSASEEGASKRYPAARVLETLQARVGLGLVATLAATFAAERLGGPPAAVAMTLWASAQYFPQDNA